MREVGREGIQDTRKTRVVRLDATPLEALKVVLLEVATGKRGGKVVALVDVRRAYIYAPSRRRVFVELPPKDYQPGDEHMCGLLRFGLYGTRDSAQNWEEELASTLSDLKLTRGIACPCAWQSCTQGEHVEASVHGDNITIVGERSAVELLIEMISRKHQIYSQVIGGDADLENRVIRWGRGGIAIEADQRRVSESRSDWTGRRRTMQEVMEASVTTNVNMDSAKTHTIGTMRMMATTRTERRQKMRVTT